MPENTLGPMPDEVCGRCFMPLNRWMSFDDPGAVEWRHPIPLAPEDEHDPEPIARSEAPYVVLVCDFCSSVGAPWNYPVGEEIDTTYAAPTFTGGEVRKRIAKHWESVTQEEGPGVDLGRGLFSDQWVACDPCSELIELRDLERLITRVRRMRVELYGRPPGNRSALRQHFASFWRLVRQREPVKHAQRTRDGGHTS